MAAPILHTLAALKFLAVLNTVSPDLFNNIDKKAFLVGTNFPDIRYLTNIDRNRTHLEPSNLEDVLKEKSSFKAGMRFHNFVDKYRVAVLEDKFFEELKSKVPFKQHLNATIMKVAEDFLLYKKVSQEQWQELTGYFDTIYEEEQEYVADPQLIQQWHQRLKEYFVNRVSLKSFEKLIDNNTNLKVVFLKRIGPWLISSEKIFDSFVKNDAFKNSLEAFYDSINQNLLAPNSLLGAEIKEAVYA